MRKILSIVSLGAALFANPLLSARAATTYGPPTPSSFPNRLFQASLIARANSAALTGVGTSSPLGITSITFANNGNTAAQVDVFQAATNGADCTGTVASIGGSPDMFIMVPGLQTVHLDFSTPLTIQRFNGQSCIGFDVVSGLTSGNNISILVNGYQN